MSPVFTGVCWLDWVILIVMYVVVKGLVEIALRRHERRKERRGQPQP